jgi:nitrate/nitrite transporter NarK
VGDPGVEPAGQAAGSAHPAPGRGGKRAYLVWLTALAVYFLAVFHRSSLGVAGIAAAHRFDISASQLSTFTMLQLLVYAGMQVPVGVLLDRHGPRRLLLAGTTLMTLAQLGFAFTGSYAGALVARVFLGMGDAMIFISVLRLIASWFPPMRNPVLSQVTGVLGQCGALTAAIPWPRRCRRTAGPQRSRSPPPSASCWACSSSPWCGTSLRERRRRTRRRTCGPSRWT